MENNYLVTYSEFPDITRGKVLFLNQILSLVKNKKYEVFADDKYFKIFSQNKNLKLKTVKKSQFEFKDIIF